MKTGEPTSANTPSPPATVQNIENHQSNGAEPPPSLKQEPDQTSVAPEPANSRFQAIENELSRGKRKSVFHDLEALRIPSAEDDDDDTSEDVLSMGPPRRPGKRAFRTRPEDTYQFEAYILEDPKEKISYYIMPSLGNVLADQDIENVKRVILVLCINKSGKMFFWPIPAKGNFRSSGLAAVALAQDAWIKAVGDLESGGYRVRRMLQTEYEEPAWPATMPSVEELLDLTFRDNVVDALDHPAVKNARDV
jgi:hypothetical protein